MWAGAVHPAAVHEAFEDLNPAESLSVELCSPQRRLCRIRFKIPLGSLLPSFWMIRQSRCHCRLCNVFWQDFASAVECGFLVGLKECPQYF